jgi:hypothetical protein
MTSETLVNTANARALRRIIGRIPNSPGLPQAFTAESGRSTQTI